MTDEPDVFAEAHAERGYTIGAYFPPTVPWEIVDGAFDHLADHVHAYTDGRWDVSVVGGAGDQLGVVGEPELTREEALELVDDLGLQTYRAEDRLAFVREMCDQADRDGTPVTTERVRSWLAYEGCGGVLRLPDEVMPLLRDFAAEQGVAAPATQASGPVRTRWLDVAKETLLAAETKARADAPAARELGESFAFATAALMPRAEPVFCHHPNKHVSWVTRSQAGWGTGRVFTATCPDCPARAEVAEVEPVLEPWLLNVNRCSEACAERHTVRPGCLLAPDFSKPISRSDSCGYVRERWDGPYRLRDRCTARPGHASEHGPWEMLP